MGNSESDQIQDQEQNQTRTRATSPDGSAPAELKPGTVIGGNYRLKNMIGRGGMGVVYLCRHLVIGRDYALKALAPEHINEANWYRFQSEGKVIAKLNHANIVRIYDMGVHAGQFPYYVMDLLDGKSLAEFIRENGPLDLDQVSDIFAQICAGLRYAHSSGIIHRDVKPSNIILTGSAVKVVDFGLAKLVGDMAALSQSQTATGEVFGSPFYMSPEQCLGAKIDERSDIYSLGCTLFEALTGRPPLRGENAFQTVLMHQNTVPPSLSECCPERHFDPALEQLVATMLKKRPSERQQSMADVQHDLARVAAGKSVEARAIFAPTPLFELDSDEAGKRVSPLPFLLMGGIVAATILSAAAVALYFQYVEKKSHNYLSAPVAETFEMKKLRRVFHDWKQISSGVVDYNGQQVRRFDFPDSVSLGKITAETGDQRDAEVDAKGTIFFQPERKIVLRLVGNDGINTVAVPEILAKIGPDDITRLELQPNLVEMKYYELSPEFFQSIGAWRSLQDLKIGGFKVTPAAAEMLSKFRPIPEMHFRSSPTVGKDVALITWLDQVRKLDLKRVSGVDPVLKKIAGSRSLQSIHLDDTDPSLEALQCLTSCPNVTEVGLSDTKVDDTKLAEICRMTKLDNLVLDRTKITRASIPQLAKLKNLGMVSLDDTDFTDADRAELARLLPNCRVKGNHGI